MATLNQLAKQKVRASGVLEVIIAMVLIMAIFGIAMMIFTNVTTSSLSAKKLKAAALADDIQIRTERSAEPGSSSFETDGYKIETIIERSEPSGLLTLTVTVSDEQGEQMAVRKKILSPKNE